MPYILPHLRPYLDAAIHRITDKAKEPGEIVYVFFKTLDEWATLRGRKFFTFCLVMGILVCTGLEFYRRRIAKYEDKKIEENGDV